MPRISSIDRLPSEVREALHGWLRDPAVTQAEAAERTNAMLDELAAQRQREKRAGRISESAVNRHELRRRKAAERTRQSRWSPTAGLLACISHHVARRSA